MRWLLMYRFLKIQRSAYFRVFSSDLFVYSMREERSNVKPAIKLSLNSKYKLIMNK